mmetsp:Transcript_43761/g.103399  ORF Transcript_43761/g.103399 Transcript_43761/m.103399 type:complete len:147 (-) Transcript_43761:14-454(-)
MDQTILSVPARQMIRTMCSRTRQVCLHPCWRQKLAQTVVSLAAHASLGHALAAACPCGVHRDDASVSPANALLSAGHWYVASALSSCWVLDEAVWLHTVAPAASFDAAPTALPSEDAAQKRSGCTLSSGQVKAERGAEYLRCHRES